MDKMFAIADDVVHLRSGGVYVIIGTPDVYRVESTNEPAYAYLAKDGTVWVRPQTEMEDGRFELIPPKLAKF